MTAPDANTAEFVGLIPAAGEASRVPGLAFSKALYPIPRPASSPNAIDTPVVRLLAGMARAGVARGIVVSRHGRSDLVDHVGDGSRFGLRLAYVPVAPTPSMPHTLSAALPFLRGAHVVLGLPDILFEPARSLEALLARQRASGAHAVLGLFPTDRPDKSDIVDVDAHGRVVRISVKRNTAPGHAWVFAAWSPVFSAFLADHVAGWRHADDDAAQSELQLAEIFLAARDRGLSVVGEIIPDGRFLDLGTADALSQAADFV